MALRDGSEAGTSLGDTRKISHFGTKPGTTFMGNAARVLPNFGSKAVLLGTESVQYVNRIYDPGGVTYVSWLTYDAPDVLGGAYPDPYGTTFAGCSGFHVAGVVRG